MGNIAVFKEAPQKWLQYDIDTEVLIEYQSKKALDDIRKKGRKIARINRIEDLEGIINQLTGRAAVKGWRKTTDHKHPGLMIDNKPLEFKTENIDMLMEVSTDFSFFVNTSCIDSKLFLGDYEEETETATEESEKNG
jgi:hypothetical protein